MSAPRTNIEKQTLRHRWPLIGMAIVVAFGVLLIAYWLFEESAGTDQPAGTGVPPAADVETAPQLTAPDGTPVRPAVPAPQ